MKLNKSVSVSIPVQTTLLNGCKDKVMILYVSENNIGIQLKGEKNNAEESETIRVEFNELKRAIKALDDIENIEV